MFGFFVCPLLDLTLTDMGDMSFVIMHGYILTIKNASNPCELRIRGTFDKRKCVKIEV